jgi:uracil-DNA glycosylase
MLIGQAPGSLEAITGRPFSGRSGRMLWEWLRLAGVEPEERVRRLIYISAITKCFPGKSRSGSGDRRPSQAEVDLCRPFLDRQLALLRPEIILLVGGLAHNRFLPGRRLDSLVGNFFDVRGRPVSRRSRVRPLLVPLPHPSGASRWLNQPRNRELLRSALFRLRPLLRPYLDALSVDA